MPAGWLLSPALLQRSRDVIPRRSVYPKRTRLRRGGISTVVAMLSLAVGVGPNAAIFSVGYAMLAHRLPYADADRLVMLRPMNPSHGLFFPTVAPANLVDWQGKAKS